MTTLLETSRGRWPVLVIGVFSLALLYALERQGLRRTHDQFLYPLDDPYIHMAMARTFAESGVYGLTPQLPATSSSSPLWVVALAGVGLAVGVSAFTPLALNVLALVLILVVVDGWWARCGLSALRRLLALGLLAFVVPLPAMAMVGLEHTAHILAVLAFAMAVASRPPEVRGSPRGYLVLGVLAGLVCGLRFEGLFLVGPAASLMLLRRQWKEGAAIAAGAAVPVVLHGMYGVSIGWAFLPTTLMVKGNFPDLHTARGWLDALGGSALVRISAVRSLTVLVFAAGLVIVLTGRERMRSPWVVLSGLFVATTFLHCQFASIDGQFGRYEAYLVALGVVALLSGLPEIETALTRAPGTPVARVVLVAMLALAAWPVASRAVRSVSLVPIAAGEIWVQPYQVSTFCRTFLAGSTVAIYDLGLVSFEGLVRPVDLGGLGSIEVARLRRARTFTAAAAADIAGKAHTDVAVLYDAFFAHVGEPAPPGWMKVASWTGPRGTILKDSTVNFYAVSPAARTWLGGRLRAFEPQLPGTVAVRYFD